MTSNANDLTERLRRRLENERREIEELTASELERLGENSRRVARNALRSIGARYGGGDRADARVAAEGVAPAASILGLGLWLGIFAGGWATMQWLSRSIQDRIETLAMANVRIEGGREMLAEIEETTWGVGLREVSGGAVRDAGRPAHRSLRPSPWTGGPT